MQLSPISLFRTFQRILRAVPGMVWWTLSLLAQALLFNHLCGIIRIPYWLHLLYDSLPIMVLSTLLIALRRRRVVAIVGTVVEVILCVWMLVNVMYFNANELFINWQVAQMAGAIRGYESALSACLDWSLLAFPALAAVGVWGLWRSSYEYGRWDALYALVVTVLLYAPVGKVRYEHRLNRELTYERRWYSPMRVPDKEVDSYLCLYPDFAYLHSHSILSHGGKFLYDALMPQSVAPLSPEERSRVEAMLRPLSEPQQPVGHCVYILVESMNGWVVEENTAYGEAICPSMRRWIETHPSVYCTDVVSQKLYGGSGDGQLIVMTGMLPVDAGVTSNHYGSNIYPNLAHFYPVSYALSPTGNLWNKSVTMRSYGCQTLLGPVEGVEPFWDDAFLMNKTRELLEAAEEPAFVFALTIDSHSPFDKYHLSIPQDESLSKTERDYINSIYQTDVAVGQFLAWADTAAVMQNATIVITGDHFAPTHNLAERPNNNACPLIITGPAVTHNIRPLHMYQMDLFATVLEAIGQNDYFWHGFGVSAFSADLSLPLEEQERPYTAGEAFRLSDRLIRTNYFATLP